jgi:hypothetical protein
MNNEQTIKDLKLRLEAKQWMKNLLTECLERRAEKAELEVEQLQKRLLHKVSVPPAEHTVKTYDDGDDLSVVVT